MPSPFLTPGSQSQPDNIALLHLRRDQTIPTVLRIHDDENLGYDEGKVTNTRFGSFPHSTLLNQPWGSQIIASKVDTGSRGRRPPPPAKPANDSAQQQLKRKADEIESPGGGTDDAARPIPKAPVAAASGFLHLLYPTPESWTSSLPHRTQVVYTPDYSYILHRLRVRPGSTILEAGAGSGSFTHAATRAVFNGYPAAGDDDDDDDDAPPTKKRRRLGKVCSFEFHEPRSRKVREEIKEHGLDGLVEVTHRDVYADGFLLGDPNTGSSPNANAVFLDLPAPWLALKHLVRHPTDGTESPLDPSSPVYICTFSPCLEQVQRTISALRQLGWLAIEMVEVNHRRIEVKRERYGLEAEGVRGAIVFPKSVDEAVSKLRSVEERAKRFRGSSSNVQASDGDHNSTAVKSEEDQPVVVTAADKAASSSSSSSSSEKQQQQQELIPSYKLGRLIHRTEQELKTHTSYLVFAVLPRDWTDADEQKCREAWPDRKAAEPALNPQLQKSKKQMKREAKAKHLARKQASQEEAREKIDVAEDPKTEQA